MQCKHHSDRRAEQFCSSCGVPICGECTEMINAQPYCFQCAMFQTVSGVGTSLKEKRSKAKEKKSEKKKKGWGPFHYFVSSCSVLILVMWGVILFGGQKPPAGSSDFVNNERVFMFMVDSGIKRYAHYEGGKYPVKLTDLLPKYLPLKEEDIPHLKKLRYQRIANTGYRLTLVNPKEGQMNIIMTPQGIQYEMPSGKEGA